MAGGSTRKAHQAGRNSRRLRTRSRRFRIGRPRGGLAAVRRPWLPPSPPRAGYPAGAAVAACQPPLAQGALPRGIRTVQPQFLGHDHLVGESVCRCGSGLRVGRAAHVEAAHPCTWCGDPRRGNVKTPHGSNASDCSKMLKCLRVERDDLAEGHASPVVHRPAGLAVVVPGDIVDARGCGRSSCNAWEQAWVRRRPKSPPRRTAAPSRCAPAPSTARPACEASKPRTWGCLSSHAWTAESSMEGNSVGCRVWQQPTFTLAR